MAESDFASQYQLERVVHRGTLGTLYLAQQLSLKRNVLLRIVGKELAADPDRRQRLMSRLESLSRAADQALVPIFDVGSIEGQPYYAMERCEGIDIKSALQVDHQMFQGPAAPDLETRVKALREFLKSCRKLGESSLDLAHLRPGDVLLVAPFRFALAEPGLASECGSRQPQDLSSLREVLGCAFAITFDPSWDARDAAGARRSPLALRSTAFQGLSQASGDNPQTVLDQALESIRSIEQSSGHRQSASRSGTFNSRWSQSRIRKTTSRMLMVVCPTLMCAAGLGFYGYSLFQESIDRADRSTRSRFHGALRVEDRDLLTSFATRSVPAPEELVEWAARALAAQREEQLDAVARECLSELLDPAKADSPGPDPSGRRRAENTDAEMARAREAILSQVQQNDSVIRTAFTYEDTTHKDALLQLLLRDLHPALKRGILLRMLAAPAPGVARVAAAALAAGCGGTPSHLDEQLATMLLDPRCDSGIALALIGYFSQSQRSISVPLLTRLVRQPDERALAQNPNRDKFLVQLYRSLGKPGDVLRNWIGPAYFKDDQPDVSPRPISLRAAALFALEKEPMDADRALALHDELSRTGGLGEVIALQTKRHADRFTDTQLLGQLRDATHLVTEQADLATIEALLEVLAKRAKEATSQALMQALRDRSIPPIQVGALFLSAIRHGLIANVDDLADFLVQVPLDAADSVTAIAALNPETRKILEQVGERSTVDPQRTRLALLRCKVALGKPADIELLRGLVEDSSTIPWLRMQALRALRDVDQPRALACIQQVIEGRAYPDDMRILAMQIASFRLKSGTKGDSYLRLRTTVENNSRESDLLRSLGKTLLESDNSKLRVYAASVLAYYDHEIVDNNLAVMLDPECDPELLYWASWYFADRMLDEEKLAMIEPQMADLLENEDVDEYVKSRIIQCLTLNRRPAFADTISTLLPDLQSDEAAEAALMYLSGHVGKPRIDEALLDFVGSPQSLDTRLRALEYLCSAMLRGQPGDFAMVETIMKQSREPAIAFGCANVLMRRQEAPLPMDILARAFVNHLRRAAAAASRESGSSASSYEYDSSDSALFSSPRVVLEVRSPELTRQLVDHAIDNDLREMALAQLVATVLVRIAKENEPPEQLDRLLREQKFTIPEMLEQVGWSSRSYDYDSRSKYGSQSRLVKSTDIRAAIDYLCEGSYPAGRCAEAHLARANLLQSAAHDLSREDGAADTRTEMLRLATLDLKQAIQLTRDDSSRSALQYSLFEIQRNQDDEDGALSTLLEFRKSQPGNNESLLQLFDHYIDMGRLEDAERVLGQFESRDSAYWERAFQFRSRTGADMVAYLKEVSQQPDWRDERAFQLLPTALRHLFDRVDDPKLEDVRKRAAERLKEALSSEFAWPRRSLAAFHLSWIAPKDHTELLALAARTDANPTVRKHALQGVLAANPEVAALIAKQEFLQKGDLELLPFGYWVLVRCGDPARTEFLRQQLQPKEPAERLRLCVAIAVLDDQASTIPEITNLLQSEHAAIRSFAATALGIFARRGQVIDTAKLLERFRHESAPEVAFSAGSTLAYLGSRDVLEDCAATIREMESGKLSEAAAEVLVPLKIRVLGNHTLHEEALAILDPLIEERKALLVKNFSLGSSSLKSAVERFKTARDDEGLGNLADLLYSMGSTEQAKEIYQLAREIDPDDSEWTEQLDLIAKGVVSSNSGSSTYDPILRAALVAQGKLKQEDQPVASFSFGKIIAVDEESSNRDPLANVLAAFAAMQSGAGPEAPPVDAVAQLRSTLDLMEMWPDFWLGRLGQVESRSRRYSMEYSDQLTYESYYGYDTSYSQTGGMTNEFGEDLPESLERAQDLDYAFGALHSLLMQMPTSESSNVSPARQLQDIRSKLAK